MRPVNPYIVGNPIKDQAGFFGRQDIFREVMQVLRQRGSNAIVLYGQRRIGKTSVLLQLEKQLVRDVEFTPVYFDLQDKAAKDLTDVLYELSQHISKVTGHAVAKRSDFDGSVDYFRSVFLPKIVEKVPSGGLVLLFDEFDVLDSPLRTEKSASETFFPYLREWMTDVRKVKFVFVIGRRPEDLSIRTMSTFKGIQSTRVSFLTKKDAEDVARQSEKEGTLKWDEIGVQHVLDLTHGHPYFTQLLCSVVWENAYEAMPRGTPTVSAKDVDGSVAQALKFGANAFNWLWDGLPPAERVVVAAMAEVKEEIITQDKLIETLNMSGVRLVARELEFAPETLIDWEVLIESDDAYRFAVPLLRRWVLTNRPLRRVKEELDRLNPLADNLYQTGYGYYDKENPDLEAATQQLRQALNVNPNHLKARLLLGQILLEKGNLAESVDMFHAAYQYDERAARADLIKSLLALAETQEENLQLSTYDRILKIQGDQPLANEKVRAIWIKRGEAAQALENYEEAIKAFEQIGDTERIEKVRSLMHEKKLALDMQRADVYEKSGQWKSALDTLIELMPEYPESEPLRARLEIARTNWRAESLKSLDGAEVEENWTKVLELGEALEKDFPDDMEIKSRADHARTQLGVMQRYHEALGVLQSGQTDQGRQMLSQVLVDNPGHLQAAHKLIEATYGKVRITRPVSWVARLLVGFISILWLFIGFASIGWLLWPLVRSIITMMVGEYRGKYDISLEWLTFIAFIFAAILSYAINYYAGEAVDAAFRVEQKEKPSFWRAAWTHFPFGIGMFYVDPSARRRWIYPVLAMAIPLVIILGPSLLGKIFTQLGNSPFVSHELFGFYDDQGKEAELILGFEKRQEWHPVLLRIVLSGYVLSFVDVLGTCYYMSRKSYHRAKKEWWQKIPGQLKPASQQRGIAVSASAMGRKLAQGFKLSLQWVLRRVRLATLGGWLGIITVFVVILFFSIESLSYSELYFLPAVILFFALLLVWIIIAIILVIKAVLRNGSKAKEWLLARIRRSNPTSTTNEADITKDKTI